MNNLISLGKGQFHNFMKAPIHQFIGRKRSQLFNLLFLGGVLFLLQQKEVSLNFNISGNPSPPSMNEDVTIARSSFSATTVADISSTSMDKIEAESTTAKAYIGSGIMSIGKEKSTASTVELSASDNLSNTYSNMTYHNNSTTPQQQAAPTAIKNDSKKNRHTLKRKKQESYVDRFAKVARGEMRKFGIPASITLAQGLIESNAGDSRLSRKNNNHFGMKCFSKKCRKGHCSNFTDDSHKDFFRKYETAWESYRAHSMLLTGKRYRRLFKLKKTDYKGWATGLKKAGYATDPKYAQKLIHIIEELNLNQYDN